jgi:hypothetical protein
MQNVAWVVPPDNPESMSSYRYNAFIPARELGGRVIYFDGGDADGFLDQYSLDAIILCKPVILTAAEAVSHPLVDLAIACKRRHMALCFHICDWHFDLPVYRVLSELADLIIVQTRPIAAAVREHFGRTPAIIEEPYEGPRGKPRFKPKKTLNLVWYGHASNLDTLVVGLAQLQRLSRVFKLSIVTNSQSDARAAFESVERPPFLVERAIISFTLERQWRELQAADMVIIPGFFAKEKNVKGHNRLVQSLHAGRLAAVFPLPQYQELADYCLCHKDIVDSIHMALGDPFNAVKRVRAGQQYIDGRFSPAAVASRWREEISNLLAGRKSWMAT